MVERAARRQPIGGALAAEEDGTGVVHQHVDGGLDRGNGCGDAALLPELREVRDVPGMERAWVDGLEPGQQRVRARRITRDEHDACAAARVLERRDLADARGRAGHHDRAAIHPLSPALSSSASPVRTRTPGARCGRKRYWGGASMMMVEPCSNQPSSAPRS